MADLHCIQRAQALLGECPRWNLDDNRLYWTDIDGRKLWSLGIDGQGPRSVEMPFKVGAFAFRAGGGMVLATDNGVYTGSPFDAADGLEQAFPYPEPHLQELGGRFNDGCCDPAGRFVVGTLDPQKQGRSCVYSFEPGAGQGRKVLDGFSTFNGLAFTPDGTQAWFADTPQRKVWRASYDVGTGDFGPRDLVIAFDADLQARPDGAQFDSEGNYWVAMYAGGCVHRISPEGSVTATHQIPATYTTMAAFAGSDLDVLAVTTAGRDDKDEFALHPDAGGLFTLTGLGATGTAQFSYAG